MRHIALLLVLLAGRAITPISVNAQQPADQCSIPSDFSIRLRTGSFNDDYYVRIGADGKVDFSGRTFGVDIAGVKDSITNEETRTVVCAVQRLNFFALRDRYATPKDGCAHATIDTAATIVTVTMNGKSKRIEHDHGCTDIGGAPFPYELTMLERQISALANVRRRH